MSELVYYVYRYNVITDNATMVAKYLTFTFLLTKKVIK